MLLCKRSTARLLGRRPVLLLLRRHYAWNPFQAATTIEEGPPEEGPLDETVINAAQELRNRNLGPLQLKTILQQLATAEPGKRCFGLMGDIIKKLSTHGDGDAKGTGAGAGASPVIPLLSDEETYAIYSQVIDNISKENFESARFIPRLFLQLLQRGDELQDNEMLLNVFIKFVQYLSVLGYSDQLYKVTVSFLSDHPQLKKQTYHKINQLLENLDNQLHPCLLVKVVDAYDYINGGKDDSTIKLKKKVVRSIQKYLNSKQDEIFSIDPQELSIFKSFLQQFINQTDSINSLAKILQCCSITNPQDFKDQRKSIISKIVGLVINSDELPAASLKLSTSIQLCQNLIESTNLQISKDEILLAGSSIIEDIVLKTDSKFNPDAFKILIEWDVFKHSQLTETSKQSLLNTSELVNTELYNSIISALVNSSPLNFQYELSQIDEFFKLNFPEVDKDLKTFEILFQKGINDKDYAYLKSTFEQSLKDGINWDEKPNMLFNFLIALTEEPGIDAKSVFDWYKKVKVFCEFLNSDSYSAFMAIMLKQDCLATALESFKHELPKLEEGSKFHTDHYPKLYQVLLDWLLNDCKDVQNAWDLYGAMMKYFELPYDSYLPVMKKFVKLGRPDASFLIFQQLKKIHRTTGKLPPPTPEMYTYLFDSFGAQLYEVGVEELHMMLKVDLAINSDINIMNSLLNSYTNIREFQKVSDIFDQISAIPTKVGLNNETLTIMLKAYTFLDLQLVSKFWNNLNEFNILPNSSNLNQYVIAHCYHGKYERAFEIVKNCENDLDIPVTKQVLESLYKWTESSEVKQQIEEWASSNHQDVWKLVEKNQLVLFETTKEDEEYGLTKRELNLIQGI